MTVKNIKPLAIRVLIKRSKAQTTKGGILLPDSAQEKPKEGVVMAVGPGKIDERAKRTDARENRRPRPLQLLFRNRS